MKLTLMEFLSLDGVSQGPGSPDQDTSDGFTLGGRLVPHMDETFIQIAARWLDEADGLLLGRRTYEAFARDWPGITDPEDLFTDTSLVRLHIGVRVPVRDTPLGGQPPRHRER
jgi:dihydrofolate reductase